MNKLYTLILLLFILVQFSCDKKEINCNSGCDQKTIVSSKLFNKTPTVTVNINSISIAGDCLKINFSSSGCSGDTWVLQLAASEAIIKTNPPKRSLRLALENSEECEANITKELTFDICNLQIEGSEVYLHFTEDYEILYTY